MTARTAFEAVLRTGLTIDLDGEDLILEAVSPPPADVLDLVARHKQDIVTALRHRTRDAQWDAQEWQALFDERAGVLEFDGGLPRTEAEARAFADCVAEWLARHRVFPVTHGCLHCGHHDRADELVVQLAFRGYTGAWVHTACWSAWSAVRETKAVDALAALGLTPPQRERQP